MGSLVSSASPVFVSPVPTVGFIGSTIAGSPVAFGASPESDGADAAGTENAAGAHRASSRGATFVPFGAAPAFQGGRGATGEGVRTGDGGKAAGGGGGNGRTPPRSATWELERRGFYLDTSEDPVLNVAAARFGDFIGDVLITVEEGDMTDPEGGIMTSAVAQAIKSAKRAAGIDARYAELTQVANTTQDAYSMRPDPPAFDVLRFTRSPSGADPLHLYHFYSPEGAWPLIVPYRAARGAHLNPAIAGTVFGPAGVVASYGPWDQATWEADLKMIRDIFVSGQTAIAGGKPASSGLIEIAQSTAIGMEVQVRKGAAQAGNAGPSLFDAAWDVLNGFVQHAAGSAGFVATAFEESCRRFMEQFGAPGIVLPEGPVEERRIAGL